MMYQACRRPGRKPRTEEMLVVGETIWEYVRLTAKSDVDQTVGAADASLDPDRDGWEEDSDQAEKNIAAAHDVDRMV